MATQFAGDNGTQFIQKIIDDFRVNSNFSPKDISDGYHSFRDLYYQRMMLFLTIQKSYPSHSWKSKQHHDGTMFDGMFIVGITTPDGQYTYHYKNEFWELFDDINEIEKAPEFDGHTSEDVTRLLSLI